MTKEIKGRTMSMNGIKKIELTNDNIKFTFNTKEKDYLYDSLCHRYIRARELMAEWEWERDHYSKEARDRGFYFEIAKKDILKFCELLNEAIGEHN